jgi:hypothetical protein
MLSSSFLLHILRADYCASCFLFVFFHTLRAILLHRAL